MRALISLMAMLAMLTAALAQTGDRPPAHFVIAVGNLPADARTRADAVTDAAVAALKPGDRLTLFSLVDQQTLGRIIVPPGRPLTERSRERRYGDERDTMKRALSMRPSPPSAPSRWPQGLAELGKLIEPGVADRRVHVIVIDNALYHDPTEPRVSMRTAYPNGALIRSGMALSPFGTAERAKRLTGVSVHFCHREEPKDFVNDQHQRLVEGAVATFVTAQGGTLASFTSAWAECRGRFLAATDTGSIAAPAAMANEVPAMVIVRPRLTDATTPTATPVIADALVRTPVVTAPVQALPTEPLPSPAVPQNTPTLATAPITTPAVVPAAPAVAKRVVKASANRPVKRRVAKAQPRRAVSARSQSPYVWECDPLTGQMVLRTVRAHRDF